MSLPSGITCTPLEYERSLRDPSIHCLTRGDNFGLTIITFAGLLSFIALLYLLLVILRDIIRRFRHPTSMGGLLFHRPIELLMLSLFLADVLQAIGGILNLKWIYDGKVMVGSFCNAQGIIQNIGETGVALNTLAIATYTFLEFWFLGVHSMTITRFVLSGIWGFILIIVAVGNAINHGRSSSYISPTPFWCWIGSDYLLWRLFAEYIWLWSALIFSLVVYIPACIFRIIRSGWHNSLFLLAYPTVYCILVLPLSIARWVAFDQEAKHGVYSVLPAVTFAVATNFQLSGLLNVVLFLITRHGMFKFQLVLQSMASPQPVAAIPPPAHLGDVASTSMPI